MNLPSRSPWVRRLLFTALLLALALAATAPAMGPALVTAVPIADPDAIVSLGSHEWERLPATAVLATAFPAARVLLTVPRQVTPLNCHDCANRVARLARRGVAPERVVLLDLQEPGTYGEARAVAAFARRHPLRRLLIVTSPYHTRRALATFTHVLGGRAQLGVAPAAASPARPSRWLLAPYDRAYVAYEWAGIGYYWWVHDVPPGARAG
jgi:uncharacterized SAM-binding protein YcdF (DUF218 family)